MLTEIIHRADQCPRSFEMLAALRDEILSLIKRGTFPIGVFLEEDVPSVANVLLGSSFYQSSRLPLTVLPNTKPDLYLEDI